VIRIDDERIKGHLDRVVLRSERAARRKGGPATQWSALRADCGPSI